MPVASGVKLHIRLARRAVIKRSSCSIVSRDNASGCMLSRKPGLEEDLAMGEREKAPDSSSGEKHGPDPEGPDEAREAAMMREILRRQERHREGGVEPELDEMDEEPRPEA